ncbi:NaeI family type II restriction endonuclease [Streptomyces mashuensis]|uniref:NaeI family type II restriction endonuclease n=1 Tax=Streptomyces mashuensis TaxID=33904 RepID=UPI00167D26C5|nr:NaeI family type II restriction endonuclease [Streptomyces mashuensis]
MRATEELLVDGVNKDGKRNLSRAGHEAIEWIHKDSRLPANVLNRLPASDLQAILAQASCQGRVNELFRLAQRQPVTPPVLATVERQRDAAPFPRSGPLRGACGGAATRAPIAGRRAAGGGGTL